MTRLSGSRRNSGGPGAGQGLFNKSGASIAAGKAVGIYWGELVSNSVFVQNSESDDSYAFDVRSVLPGSCDTCVVDGWKWRSSLALTNDPRADPLDERGMGDIDAIAQEANVMSELFDVCGMPLVVFVSTAAIAEDEEILIDYGQGYWEQRRRNLDYERQVARLQRAMERDWGSESATRLENVELREKLARARTDVARLRPLVDPQQMSGNRTPGHNWGRAIGEESMNVVQMLSDKVDLLEHQMKQQANQSRTKQNKLLGVIEDLKQRAPDVCRADMPLDGTGTSSVEVQKLRDKVELLEHAERQRMERSRAKQKQLSRKVAKLEDILFREAELLLNGTDPAMKKRRLEKVKSEPKGEKVIGETQDDSWAFLTESFTLSRERCKQLAEQCSQQCSQNKRCMAELKSLRAKCFTHFRRVYLGGISR